MIPSNMKKILSKTSLKGKLKIRKDSSSKIIEKLL